MRFLPQPLRKSSVLDESQQDDFNSFFAKTYRFRYSAVLVIFIGNVPSP